MANVNKQLLTDVRFVRLSLDEAAQNDGKIRVKGEFAKCGIATENKRVYPGTLWEKEIKRLDKAMGERRVFGEMDHPADGRTSLNRASHIVTGLKVTKDGLVVGEAEVLPTESGKNLMALLQSGCKVGVSSRGYGSTKSNNKGEEVVQDDYKLVTFDFVAEPADNDAFPAMQSESKQIFEGVDIDMDETTKPQTEATEQELAKKFADKVMADDAAAKGGTADPAEALSKDILQNIQKMKAEAREEVRAELLADPQVAAAKEFVEKLKNDLRPFMVDGDAALVLKVSEEKASKLAEQVKDLTAQLATAKTESEKATRLAHELGFKLFIEQQLAMDPDGELVRKIVGEVTQYDRLDVLKAKIAEVKSELAAKREEARLAEEKRKQEIAEATAKVEEAKKLAESKAAELEKTLREALLNQQQLAFRLKAEQMLTKHPLAAKIRPMVESTKFSSSEDVDRLFETFRESKRDADEQDDVRSRVRSRLNGGSEDETPVVEQTQRSTQASVQDYNGLGVSTGELKRLAGLNK